MLTLCQFGQQFATLHGPGLVYPTRQDPRHTIWIFSWQKHAAPAFILRHLKDVAQKMQRSSSRLYTAFIDFKQANDSIPRSKLWDQLRKNQMPNAHPHAVHPRKLMLMNTRYIVCWWIHAMISDCSAIFWRETRAPCPFSPNCFPFNWMTLIAWLMGCRVRSLLSLFLLWNACCLLKTKKKKQIV